jgi:hypothetical protein
VWRIRTRHIHHADALALVREIVPELGAVEARGVVLSVLLTLAVEVDEPEKT